MWRWLKSWFVKPNNFEIRITIKNGINPENGLNEPLVFMKTIIPEHMDDRTACTYLRDLLFALETSYFHSGFIRSINECRDKLGDAVNTAIIEIANNMSNSPDNPNNEDNIVIYPTEVFNRK